jgi:tRNA (guanine37-N1)-methyltransferase
LRFNVVSLFPEIFSGFVSNGLIKRALDKSLISINFYNPRNFTKDKHRRVDDSPYGGGAGMVLRIEPLYNVIQHIKEVDPCTRVVYLSAAGKQLTQNLVNDYSQSDCSYTLVAGRYEGVDQRFIDLCVDEELAFGASILMGGEVPAMAFIEAVSRYVPDVLGNSESLVIETFLQDDPELGEYPQYTKPRSFLKIDVPDVLLSGNHQEIEIWRKVNRRKINR